LDVLRQRDHHLPFRFHLTGGHEGGRGEPQNLLQGFCRPLQLDWAFTIRLPGPFPLLALTTLLLPGLTLHLDPRHLSINFHHLKHLPGCVEMFGPLWATSCFPFESTNHFIRLNIHGTGHVLSQVLALPSREGRRGFLDSVASEQGRSCLLPFIVPSMH
jgi:hypothetical protein